MSSRAAGVGKAEVMSPGEGSVVPLPSVAALVDFGSLPVLILLALLFWNHTCRKWQDFNVYVINTSRLMAQKPQPGTTPLNTINGCDNS